MSEVDAHFHVWELERFSYPWPNSEVGPIFRDIGFTEFAAALESAGITNAVFIQCLNNCIDEAKWVLEFNHPYIKGVVAGVDLNDPVNLEKQLNELGQYEKFVGVRHMLEWEKDPNWVLSDCAIECLKIVAAHGLSFDYELMLHSHLENLSALADAIPNLRIVINHIAKPLLLSSEYLSETCPLWKKSLHAAAAHPNVYCKISGLVTEVDPVMHATPFSKETFSTHISEVLSAFGSERCMLGSDWPVLELTGKSYKEVNLLHKSLIAHLTAEERQMIIGGNAKRFYKLQSID